MNHSLNGEPRAAAKALLAHGAKTQNSKLIDMARMVLQRHAERIADSADLLAMADELMAGLSAAAAPSFSSNGNRQAGGVTLRSAAGAAPGPAPAATAA